MYKPAPGRGFVIRAMKYSLQEKNEGGSNTWHLLAVLHASFTKRQDGHPRRTTRLTFGQNGPTGTRETVIEIVPKLSDSVIVNVSKIPIIKTQVERKEVFMKEIYSGRFSQETRRRLEAHPSSSSGDANVYDMLRQLREKDSASIQQEKIDVANKIKGLKEREKKIRNITQGFKDLYSKRSIPSDTAERFENLERIGSVMKSYLRFAPSNESEVKQYKEEAEKNLKEARKIIHAELQVQKEEVNIIKKELEELKQKEAGLRENLKASLRSKRDEINDHFKRNYRISKLGVSNSYEEAYKAVQGTSEELQKVCRDASGKEREIMQAYRCYQLAGYPNLGIQYSSVPQDSYAVDTEGKYQRNLSEAQRAYKKSGEIIPLTTSKFAEANGIIGGIEKIYKKETLAKDYDELKKRIQGKLQGSNDSRLVEFHSKNLGSLERAKQLFNEGVQSYKGAMAERKKQQSFSEGLLQYDFNCLKKHEYYTHLINIIDEQQFDSNISKSTINPELTRQLDDIKREINRKEALQAPKSDLFKRTKDILDKSYA